MQPQGRLELDHQDLCDDDRSRYSASANRDLLTSKYADRDDRGEAAAERRRTGAGRARPPTSAAPGETVTFVEQLTSEASRSSAGAGRTSRRGRAAAGGAAGGCLCPGGRAWHAGTCRGRAAAPGRRPPGATPPAAGATAAGGAGPIAADVSGRAHGVRGITKGGRPGPPAARVQLPIVDVPPPPTSIKASNTEKSIVVEWAAPAAPAPATLAYNVYKPDGTVPLNPQPMTAVTFESPGVEFGTEQCFAVRSVEPIGGVPIESALSVPVCFTPKDTFAPAAPKGVGAVARPGVVDITWDPNTEPDLAGYLVLRGEAANEAPVQLTPAPIADTHYLDSTARPDVLYSYFIVAIDKPTTAQPERSVNALSDHRQMKRYDRVEQDGRQRHAVEKNGD